VRPAARRIAAMPPMEIITFGPFCLRPASRLLEKDGVPLKVGSRALDLLMVLLERAGEIISNKELVTRVWRGLVVEASSLRVHMTELRRTLGDRRGTARYVVNVPGQGYCFVAPFTRRDANESAPAPELALRHVPSTLPPILDRIIGREDAIANVARLVIDHHIVTIVAAGGIGKTTVAVAVGHELAGTFPEGVHFVDFSTAKDSAGVLTAVVAAMLSGFRGQADASDLPARLPAGRALLILDNCEHVINEVAAAAEAIVGCQPHIHVLATSRETLRVRGERVFSLPPLPFPPDECRLKAATTCEFPAIQLFVDRARAAGGNFELTDANAGVVASVCRRLDGIALAIELAAERAGIFGLADVASGLESGIHLRWRGRRTAAARHRDLMALYDWSYDLLPEGARMVFRALSKLSGPFSLDVARAIATGTTGETEAFDSLVTHCLLAHAACDDPSIGYRLPHTGRAYVEEKSRRAAIEADRASCA